MFTKKKILSLLILFVLLIIIVIAAIMLIQKIKADNDLKISQDFSKDLVLSFQKAITDADLPKTSLVIVDSYTEDESKPEAHNFEDNANSNSQFYMASTIKPFYIASFLNLLDIHDINYQVPLKFVENEKNKKEMAHEIYVNVKYHYEVDQLLVDFIIPLFKDQPDLTEDQIYQQLMTDPKLVNYKFSLKDLIQYTLGPSSNWSLLILRDHLALQKSETVEQASSLIEEYLNDVLKNNGVKSTIHINLSTNSTRDKTFNTANFYESEYLFEWFYQNWFRINKDIFNLMKSSMQEIAQDPQSTNRRHEIKSIVKDLFNDKKVLITEKSGYIGLDYSAAPGLNKANGWDKLPQIPGKRIVFFDASSFSRIFLNSGRYVQFNYNISVPVYISLNPSYEELNNDYLTVKNKILNALNDNLKQIFIKYKDDLQTTNQS